MHCTARSKRTGQPCQRPAMTGKTVCYHHGGKSRAGLAAPAFKTGRYSKYLPARLLDRYEAALADDTLLELREEIALLDARLVDLLSRVDTGEAGGLWLRARAAWEASQSADAATALAARLELAQLFTDGVADYEAWAAVSALMTQRQRLVESERKRLVEMQQTITVERAMLLLTAIIESVRTHVNDPTAMAAISADFLRLTAGAGRDVDGGPARRD